MSTPVEALSISSLINLLANPPQYPRNPTHQPNDPLVLYIVRVPGSKDVFLTSLKPPTKASVSLEAVQSSLYYLHVERPDDEILRRSLDAERAADTQRPPPPPILRKPLPPTPFANYPASLRPSTPPKSYPFYQPQGTGPNGATQAERYVSRGSHVRLTSPDDRSSFRKPLGARPLPSQVVTNENVPPPSQHDVESLKAEDSFRCWSVPDRKPAPWTPRLQVPDDSLQPDPQFDSQGSGTTSKSPSASDITTITLIRRDPSSGTQWNVASIKVESRRHSLALLQPVEVILTTPGYSKFARGPQPSSEEDGNESASPTSNSPGSTNFFKRRVGFRPLPEQYQASLQHVRANSGDFLSDLTNTPAKKVRQVYSFTSPWQGVCAFSNGVDGKSLRCRHSLPISNSQQVSSSAGVAELRFNLPWSVLRSREANRQAIAEADKLPISQLIGKSPREQWRRSVQGLKPKSWHSRLHSTTISGGEPPKVLEQKAAATGDDWHDEGRLSLKLGREKAGGGFKGQSAKLGKLIIEDEGLKMCDLIVAACMGVWWQHYMEGNTIS